MKKNCWEFRKCGQEVGGDNTHESGICPAAMERALDGTHDGIGAGRACWVVKGTLCNGSIHGPFEQKYRECAKCDFYNYVKEQEGDELLPTLFLLNKIRDVM